MQPDETRKHFLKAGTAQVDITPPPGIALDLYGYSGSSTLEQTFVGLAFHGHLDLGTPDE